ncbi:unnamed protein product [Ceutorhynchus assimilis]|uniref:Uncharacterized protein n=1 Tax=Ceutorhynchus assimilis TaxID=467358 RepID=A0A9N9MQT8_9CUCU|nr:unnamed protein product [Ceutorhynchus assimilis]
MQNQEPQVIGDVNNNDEILLQDRIVRILSYSEEPSNVLFLYFNEEFPADPPSCSLFDDDIQDEIGDGSFNSMLKESHYNLFPKLVTSKILVGQEDTSYRVEDIVTSVYFPSEEFACIEELSPIRKFFSRIWSWCKPKANCNND